MKVLIVGGGHPDTWPLDVFQEEYRAYIGVDRGSLYLLAHGQRLDAAIGDFDSLTVEEYTNVKNKAKYFKQSPAEKDDTDTQLALLYAIEHYPEADFRFIGLTGGRMDHFLANFWMVLEPRFTPFARQIELVNQQNIIEYYLPGHYVIEKKPQMRYLAYVCLTPMKELTLHLSKYTLNKQKVDYPISYASNEFVGDTAEFTFSDGVMAVIYSKDKTQLC